MSLAEAERVKNDALADREEAEARARQAEARCRDLEKSFGNDTLQYQVASLTRDCDRLQADLKAERESQLQNETDNDKRIESLQKVI